MATYEGQTKARTRAVVLDALGGVFFLDEAYALVKRGRQGYGAEALDELMFLMDDELNPVMIFAGYESDMEDFIKMNEGLRRRVKVLKLEPFSDEELAEIIEVKVASQKAAFDDGVNVLQVVKEMNDEVKKDNNGGAAARIVEAMAMVRVREVRYKKKSKLHEALQVVYTQSQLQEAANMVGNDLRKPDIGLKGK